MSVISNEPPQQDGKVLFTTVPKTDLSDQDEFEIIVFNFEN